MSLKPPDNVVSHWAVLIDDFDTSGQKFFAAIERNVAGREIPEVKPSRVRFRQSGVLSDKREYLRLQRDNLIFDVGAAPYGTGFFFSWWLIRTGSRFPWAYPLGFFLVWLLITGMLDGFVGLVLGPVAAVGGLIGIGKSGLVPEEHVAQAPIVGWLYRRLVNPETYHSLDLVSMYQESIRRAVNEAVDESLKAAGRSVLTHEQRALTSGATIQIDSGGGETSLTA